MTVRWRGVAMLALVVALLVIPAGPVSADPARPTNFRSRVLSVEPPLPSGVELRVVGGDAFLDLTVRGGHQVVVPDYASGSGVDRRPYLRFGRDGVVERNEHSAAAVANESRDGSGANPDIGPEPRWVAVGRNGRYAWHDHRIHWMLPQTPTAVDQRGRVDLGGPAGTWSLDLVIDGTPTTVTGELILSSAPSPLPWYILTAATAIAIVGAAVSWVRRGHRAPHRVIAVALGIVSVLAIAVAAGQRAATPPEGGPTIIPLVIAVIGVLGALLAVAVGNGRFRLGATAVAIAAVAGWTVLRLGVLSHAVLPTTLPYGIDRGVTAVALGVAIGATAMLVWQPPRA